MNNMSKYNNFISQRKFCEQPNLNSIKKNLWEKKTGGSHDLDAVFATLSC